MKRCSTNNDGVRNSPWRSTFAVDEDTFGALVGRGRGYNQGVCFFVFFSKHAIDHRF